MGTQPQTQAPETGWVVTGGDSQPQSQDNSASNPSGWVVTGGDQSQPSQQASIPADLQGAYARMQHAPIPEAPKPTYIQSREQAISDQATGVAKGAAETVHTVGSFLNKHLGVPMPEEILRPELEGGLEAKNTDEKVGKFAENIGELWLGSEAAKGLALPEKLGITQKIVELAKTSPTAAKIWSMGLHALETFSGVTGQQVLHGEPLGEAAKTGGLAAGGGALLEGGGAAYQALGSGAVEKAGEYANPLETRTAKEVSKISSKVGLEEGGGMVGTRFPAQKIKIVPESTSTQVVPGEGKLVMTPEELAAHERQQAMAETRASEQGMRSAAQVPRMAPVEGEAPVTKTVTTPGKIIPGKEYMTMYSDNPTLSKLPATEEKALNDLIRPTVTKTTFGTDVDWGKVESKFGKMSTEEQQAAFKNPKAVGDAIHQQAVIHSVKGWVFGTTDVGKFARLAALEEFIRNKLK